MNRELPRGRRGRTLALGRGWVLAFWLLTQVLGGAADSSKSTRGTRPPATPVEELDAIPAPAAPVATNPVAPAASVATPAAGGKSGSSNAIAPGSASGMVLDDERQLKVGDRLSIRIVEDQEDPKPVAVTDSGEVEVPYLGRRRVVGVTCRALAAQLKAELEKDYYYQATVVISVDQFSRAMGKVYVVGYVRGPGPQDIPNDEVYTLSKAIMHAGGFSEFADKRRVQLTRKNEGDESHNTVMEVNVGAVIEEGKAEKDVRLESGDIIYVPSRLFKF